MPRKAVPGKAVRKAAGKAGYHHGDLRAALIEVAVDLIGERGVKGFSLAEASRRLGVTVAAPYRHFADREELLAAVALHASEAFAGTLARETDADATPVDRLVAAASSYVRFAAHQRPLFQALFAAGLDKSRHPDLEHTARALDQIFLEPARALVRGEGAEDLVLAVVAGAHGHASLLLDGAFGPGPAGVDSAVERVQQATRALVDGRKVFRR